MGKKKRSKGHFCKICQEVKSNESFSGKGHRSHTCKTCAKQPIDKRNEILELSQVLSVGFNENGITKKGKRLLLNRIKNSRYDSVRKRAKEMLEESDNYRNEYEGQVDDDFLTDYLNEEYTFLDDEDIPF